MRSLSKTALAAALLVSLSACGGLSEMAQDLSDKCIETAAGTQSECRCFAKQIDSELTEADADLINRMMDGDIVELGGQLMSDPDMATRFARVENIMNRASERCIG